MRSSRWVQLTPETIAYYRAIAVARRQKHEYYIRASADDDVISLAPYIVESDDSLVLARLRRELETGRRTHVSRIPEITPLTDPHLRTTTKADHAFFGGYGNPAGAMRIRQSGPSVGAPADAPAMALFYPPALFDFFRGKRISSIFAAPPDAQP